MASTPVLETCAGIEETVGEIYRCLADSVACEDKVRALWRQMAADEDGHAAQIRRAQQEPGESAVPRSRAWTGEVEQLRRRVQSIAQGVRDRAPQLGDALRVSAKLEQDFLKVHAARGLVAPDDRLRELFRGLARADEEHLAALNELLAHREHKPFRPT